eukprot:COSAG05_NODE_301_length_11860_cov_30.927812_4_plen_145_part_00
MMYKASSLPLLTPTLSYMHSVGVKPQLDLTQRGVPRGRVGVISIEPGSYYSIASESCRAHEGVSLLLSPSINSTLPLPYFSWYAILLPAYGSMDLRPLRSPLLQVVRTNMVCAGLSIRSTYRTKGRTQDRLISGLVRCHHRRPL